MAAERKNKSIYIVFKIIRSLFLDILIFIFVVYLLDGETVDEDCAEIEFI